MPAHHFLSYSSFDGKDFALQLYDRLSGATPPIPVWFDKRCLQPDDDWDEQIDEALSTCDSLLFVMTRDSVAKQSVCKNEWSRALQYKKPVIVLMLHSDAKAPLRLCNRHYIPFAGDFDDGLEKLRQYLVRLASPAGRLKGLQDRLEDAQRDRGRTDDAQQLQRINADIAELEKQIAELQRVVDDPQAAAKQVEQRIAAGLERERKPEKPISGKTGSRFINPPPGAAPSYFQDRTFETKMVGDFLSDGVRRVVTIVGRGGIGKTTLVCRLLKDLEGGQLPDGRGALGIDGIVYLSANGSRRVSLPNIYADLCKLLDSDVAEKLEALYKNPKTSTLVRMQSLLAEFPTGRIVLLLDNFEDLLDDKRHIQDAELAEALKALLLLPAHAVKVVITTRVAPLDLALVQPARQARLDLDEGLDSPYAENILRAMDADGKVGLKSAPDALLAEARNRTRGYPRALEALFAILSADRDTTLQEVLAATDKLLPENVVEVLVGEAFNRLDHSAQLVMQALAVYPCPVTPTAIDYLLQPHVPGVDSGPILNRLVNMQLARKEGGRYYLHPVDRAYAVNRVPQGATTDRNADPPPWTRYALQHRGANYFKQTRQPRENRKSIDDLAPHLAEFELRFLGEDYDLAASVLLEINNEIYWWGHYRLEVELNERLFAKLTNPPVRAKVMRHLGDAYGRVGQLAKAIEFKQKALEYAREHKEHAAEYGLLNSLGVSYGDLGENLRAIEVHQQALQVARRIGSNLEGTYNNLGYCYGALGESVRAVHYCLESVAISNKVGNKQMECIALKNAGYFLTDMGEASQAARVIGRAIRMGDAINCVQAQHYGRHRLALALLHLDDLHGARSAAEAALPFDVPANKYFLLALIGVIALRQEDKTSARDAFTAALAQADAMLADSATNYLALHTKGITLAGLALCGDRGQVRAAVDSFSAALAINKDAGIVRRTRRLLGALCAADKERLLADAQAVLGSELESTAAPGFVKGAPTTADNHMLPQPIVSHADEWLTVYDGGSGVPVQRTQEFQRILNGDDFLLPPDFADFVAQHRDDLGDLLIWRSGLLEIVSKSGQGRKLFAVLPATAQKLIAL